MKFSALFKSLLALFSLLTIFMATPQRAEAVEFDSYFKLGGGYVTDLSAAIDLNLDLGLRWQWIGISVQQELLGAIEDFDDDLDDDSESFGAGGISAIGLHTYAGFNSFESSLFVGAGVLYAESKLKVSPVLKLSLTATWSIWTHCGIGLYVDYGLAFDAYDESSNVHIIHGGLALRFM